MKILKYFSILIVFCYALLFFCPKENFYYALESKLDNYKIYLSQERLHVNIHALTLSNPSIVYNDIVLGQVEGITLSSFLVYSSFTLKNATIESKKFSMLPTKIDTLAISHNIFIPHKLHIHANTDLGDIHGFLDLYKQKILLQLTPHKDAKQKYSNILGYFTPQQEGIYTYEKNISLY